MEAPITLLVTFITVKSLELKWQLLIASLSGSHGALRLRIWRALKALGAAALRDGVYIAPATDGVSAAFKQQAAEIISARGSAFVFTLSVTGPEEQEMLPALFDRTGQYVDLISALDALVDQLDGLNEAEARRRLRQYIREFASIEATDFFAGDAHGAAGAAIVRAHTALDAKYSPEEPTSVHAAIPQYDKTAFRDKVWATRSRIWVDRVCSAWLIRRFVDPRATFLWLEHAADCPASAIGFDFDGAPFTHIEQFVTFEVLMRSFGLEADTALQRLAALVHHLDVGGGRVPEAAGFEAILTGARERCLDDTALLDDMSKMLDDMYRAFQPTLKGP